MSGFTSYASTALLRRDIQHWAAQELPLASHRPHDVEVCSYRFRVRLSSIGSWLRVHVDEVPFWQMTPRQLCNAVWRTLRACLAPAACRAAKLREDVRKDLDGTMPTGVTYADGKWWTPALVCAHWQRCLGEIVERGDGEVPPTTMPTAPDFTGLRVQHDSLEPIIAPMEALIQKPRWANVTWKDIEPILLMLYSVSSDGDSTETTALRDRSFAKLFSAATERLGFSLEVAQRLIAAMDCLPRRAGPWDAVRTAARSLWFAAARLALCSALAGGNDGVPVERLEDRFHQWARLSVADADGFGFVRARELVTMGGRLLSWHSETNEGTGHGEAAAIAHVLNRIVDSATWSEQQRSELRQACRASDASVPAAGPRRWGRPPSSNETAAANTGPGTATL